MVPTGSPKNLAAGWRKRPEKKGDPNERKRLVASALEELDRKKEPATIESVCKPIGLNHETIRLWGLLPMIKEYKLHMHEIERENTETELILKADLAIEELGSENKKVLSELVYEKLCVRRTVAGAQLPKCNSLLNKINIDWWRGP